MELIKVIYHAEPEGYWAESPDLPGFSAAGDTLGEVARLVRESVTLWQGVELPIQEKFADDVFAVLDGGRYQLGLCGASTAPLAEVRSDVRSASVMPMSVRPSQATAAEPFQEAAA